jgi:heme exporter protein A
VSVEGLDISDRRDEVRRRVGLLSHASYLYEALTALDNLRVAARFLGRDARRPALLEELRAMGLADRADDPVSTFSAGMRKRLTFARVLLQQPSLVLLDEPYGQLDPPGFRLVDDVVRGLRARGATVVMATHQLERGAALCDHGLVLERGRVAWTGPAGDLPARGVLAADAGEGA